MTEKNVKILFALGMTLSFWVILAIMAIFSAPSPSGSPVAQPYPAGAARQELPSRPRPQSGTADRQDIEPNQEVVEQLTDLKQGLSQQLDFLKQDRDTMLVFLARGLNRLPAAEAAAELAALDDELAALTLSHLTADRRRQILRHLGTQRGERIRRRLDQLTSR